MKDAKPGFGFFDSWSMFLRIDSYKCNAVKLIGLGGP